MADLNRESFRAIKRVIKQQRINITEGVIEDAGKGFFCLFEDPNSIEKPIVWAFSVDGSRQTVFHLINGDNLTEEQKQMMRQNGAFMLRNEIKDQLEELIKKEAKRAAARPQNGKAEIIQLFTN